MLNSSAYMSDKSDWETPPELFDRLNKEFKFTIDVCANDKNRKCDTYLTERDDALSAEWSGVIWMNPPYGDCLSDWVGKAYHTGLTGSTVVCLIPARTDTRWWHKFVMMSAEVRFLTRRLSFVGSTNKAPMPCCIVVFAPHLGAPIMSSYEV
jgi:site-specific DNA-methyltransferase (adenine-specific)